MGSSTSYGYFGNPEQYPRDSAWAFKIKKYYKDLGVIDTLFNIATNGIDCYTGMPTTYVPPAGRNLPDNRFNISRAVKMLPKPDVIIVNFPTNNYDWLDPYEVIACLKTIRDTALLNNIRCYITTTQPRDNFNLGERDKLKNLKRLIDSTFGQWSIDFWTDIVQDPPIIIRPPYALGDGVHLNPAGHTVLKNIVIAKNIFAVALPLRFVSFSARKEGERVSIKWKTEQEDPHTNYTVERSDNGSDFSMIGSVTGNSSFSTSQYAFNDEHPFAGFNYYRIKSMSAGGNRIYSNIIKVDNKNDLVLISNLYPSLAHNSISVLLTGSKTMNISVADMQGKIVYKTKVWVEHEILYPISIEKLPAGIYTLNVQSDGAKESRKFIKY